MPSPQYHEAGNYRKRRGHANAIVPQSRWECIPPEPLERIRWVRRGAPGDILPRTLAHKVLWNSYPPIRKAQGILFDGATA